MPRSLEEANAMADAAELSGPARAAFVSRLTGGAAPAEKAPAVEPKAAAPAKTVTPTRTLLARPAVRAAPTPSTAPKAAPPRPAAFQMEKQVVTGTPPARTTLATTPRAPPPAYVSPTQRTLEAVTPDRPIDMPPMAVAQKPASAAPVSVPEAAFGRGAGLVSAVRQPIASAVRHLPETAERLAPRMETANPTNVSWDSPTGRLLRMMDPTVVPMSQRIAEAEQRGEETIARLESKAHARSTPTATPVADAFSRLSVDEQAARTLLRQNGASDKDIYDLYLAPGAPNAGKLVPTAELVRTGKVRVTK